MSSSAPDGVSPPSPSSTPLASPRDPPRLDTSSQQRPRPRPKLVSFNRESIGGGRPNTDGRPHIDFIEEVAEHSPFIDSGPGRMSREIDPLLKEAMSPLDDDDWQGEQQTEETKSSWFLFLLTFCGLGLQIGWSVETSNGSPYLLSLGLSKSMLALVWIAGPLSGVLVQPYVGLKSDNCRLRWGKRRPFIVGGAAATIVSLMVLAWAKEIVGGFLGVFGANPESTGVKTSIMLFAVLFVYVLDFAINIIQAGVRAYIVDVAPTHQQESANAWLMRSAGIGNIAGYLAGYIKLKDSLSWLGDSQFKILCAIASFIMALTVGVSVTTCQERDPTWDPAPEEQEDGVLAFFRGLYRSVSKLPAQIKRVCEVQFLAWIGWFPFLFYITTYVGEIYVDPFFEKNPHMSDAEIDEVWEEATRIGTRALLLFAIVTFIASVFLPFVIPPTFQAPEPDRPHTPATPMTPATPHSMGGSGYFALSHTQKGTSKSFTERIFESMEVLQIKSLTLRRAWFFSHIAFAVLMVLTFFIKSTMGATILVGAIGIPWCITNWAPFAIIASEISKRDAIRRGLIRPRDRESQLVAPGEGDATGSSADSAGVVLGIHNVAIAAPQVIATLISAVMFKLLQKPRGTAGDDSVAWVLRFGGICGLVAAWLTLRVHEEKEEVTDEPFRRRMS
ncbi:major facilitator superfamily domain-containing protein [Phaeosphaeriaceae sp. PMI808]|nr:major facilitator superfamily domain-containing protein [Phaeosphaeriaceae sp. PMI808]